MKKEISTFIKILEAISENSTCRRIQVAAILIKDGRIVSTGWNGVPSKQQHCLDYFAGKDDEYVKKNHVTFSDNNELHAETNAILHCAKNGISTLGTDLYVTYYPCKHCVKQIISCGIKKVYYLKEYDREDAINKELLKKSGIEVEKIG